MFRASIDVFTSTPYLPFACGRREAQERTTDERVTSEILYKHKSGVREHEVRRESVVLMDAGARQEQDGAQYPVIPSRSNEHIA